jgi:hypothetical protein
VPRLARVRVRFGDGVGGGAAGVLFRARLRAGDEEGDVRFFARGRFGGFASADGADAGADGGGGGGEGRASGRTRSGSSVCSRGLASCAGELLARSVVSCAGTVLGVGWKQRLDSVGSAAASWSWTSHGLCAFSEHFWSSIRAERWSDADSGLAWSSGGALVSVGEGLRCTAPGGIVLGSNSCESMSVFGLGVVWSITS